MKPLRWVVLAVLALTAAPATYAGEWYVQALVGVNFADDIEYRIDDGDVETSLDTGWLWGIGFGYEFKHIRLDAEVDTTREDDVDEDRLDGSKQDGSSGDVQSEAGMANVVFDFRKDKRVSPYIGAGIGWAEIELKTDIAAGEDNVLAWQILGGVGLEINEDWIVDLSLRYYDTADGDFNTSRATGDEDIEVDYSALSVTVGVRYVF